MQCQTLNADFKLNKEDNMNRNLSAIVIVILIAAALGFGYYAYKEKQAKDVAQETATMAPADTAPNITQPDAAQKAGESAATEPSATSSDDVDAPDAKPANAGNPDNPVVAKVNGEDVYRSDVMEFAKALPPQMRQVPVQAIYPMLLEQVINSKIVDQKAKAANTESNPEVAKQLSSAKTQIVRAVYAEAEMNKAYKESDTKKAYDDMVAKTEKVMEVKAAHILVDDEAKAKEVITKLEGGAKFADLAKEYSKDKSNAQNGGELGYFAQSDMVKEFADAAFALNKGDYTKAPVKTQFGYHVILQEDKRERPAPSYDEVKGELEAKVKRDTLNKLVEDWSKQAKVERFDYDGKPIAEKKPAATPEAAPAAPAAAPASAPAADESPKE